ncbi:glycosyltransferase [Chitinimonas naiadis]
MANQTRQLAELLRAGQASVCLVQTNPPYSPGWVATIPGLRAVFRLFPYLAALWRAAGSNDVFHIMANSGWSWHLFATPAIWIARIRGVPVVVNYRGGEAGAFLARSQALVRWSMHRAAALIVPSRFLQEVFADFGMKADIVPNIIDLARFRPRELSPQTSWHLVVARNLEPLYDNETALRAFALVHAHTPATRLTIAGSGPEAERLQALAEELGLQAVVHFAGRLDREAMAALYRDADVMLNPSLADNMPNSVLEAMASGVPVVSTDVGGIPYIVENGVTALLVKPGDVAGMAAATLRLLEEPMLWQRLRDAGIAEVQRYTWHCVAPVLAGVYRTVQPITSRT